GQRFEIRVVEEIGGWPEGGGVCSRRCGREEEISSRASSDGGVSVVAMVEGVSDAGSDADISDSCQ
ncbi:hypothetical protein A2U01_0118355, partial [Trifolium medium]|nr:hypothetical protein [Trifolium medium]